MSNCTHESMRLYAVTERSFLKGYTLEEAVAACLEGGVTFIQLREKDCPAEEEERLARALQSLCKKASEKAGTKIPFVINDHVELAQKIDADGVHVGQEDCSCINARAMLGPNKIVGVSVANLDQALQAEADGADYLGVGAMYFTATKPEAADVTIEELAKICESVSIPVVAIGGLNEQTIPNFADTGVDGAAVVSAIFAQDDIKQATADLRALLDRTLQ